MDFDICLTHKDFYCFLTEHSFTKASKTISRLVSAAALLGSTAVMFKNGVAQGFPLFLLGFAFMLWAPLTLSIHAGQMLTANRSMTRLHYHIDACGITLAPPDKKEKHISWSELQGAEYGKAQIVLRRNAAQIYILPRAQIQHVPALETHIRFHVPSITPSWR